jgi:putative tributyrin esterase
VLGTRYAAEVMTRRLGILLVAVLCAVVWAGAGDGRVLAVDTEVSSVALRGPVHALVVLPADYATTTRRYPVVYFLHGLPATSSTYRASGWLTRLVSQAGSFILVEPQGARDRDSDPEYLDWGDGRDWSTYLTRELPQYIDAHYRTIRSRNGRAIVGLSAGGYGAAMLGLNNLGEFGAIESWSGYFHATDPTGKRAIPAPSSADVHGLISSVAADLRKRPTFLAFYVGRSDPTFVAENEQFDRELTAAGVPHRFALYPGGHTTSVWATHAVAWLRLALAHLSA